MRTIAGMVPEHRGYARAAGMVLLFWILNFLMWKRCCFSLFKIKKKFLLFPFSLGFLSHTFFTFSFEKVFFSVNLLKYVLYLFVLTTF